MSGPVLVVILRSEITHAEARELIARFGPRLGLSINDQPEGGEYLAYLALPSGACLDVWLYPAESESDPDELDVLAGLLGYRPTLSLAVGASTRDPSLPAVLASLAADFAEATDSFVDMNGVLWPPGASDDEVDLAEEMAVTREYLAERPGTVVEVPYESASGPSISHVVDAEFLRGWLADPDFSLIN